MPLYDLVPVSVTVPMSYTANTPVNVLARDMLMPDWRGGTAPSSFGLLLVVLCLMVCVCLT